MAAVCSGKAVSEGGGGEEGQPNLTNISSVMLLGFQYGESLGLAPGHLGESPMRTGESLRRVPKNIKYVRGLNGASLSHYVILNSTISVFYLVA